MVDNDNIYNKQYHSNARGEGRKNLTRFARM